MRIKNFAFFLLVFIAGCTGEVEASCSGVPLNSYLGIYVVEAADRYRGGLTSEDAANERIGNEVLVLSDKMVTQFSKVQQPSYKIRCYPVKGDSENVPAKRWSNFYGLASERESVDVLEVYGDEGQKEPAYTFEIVEGKLWELFDGWKYELRKQD